MLSGMQKHPKRPRDPNQLGKLIVALSVGETEEMPVHEGKNLAAMALGQRGGKARAKSLSAECIGTKKTKVTGNPDLCCVSISFVERQNLTMRMSIRRFTRLTNAFSKKIENHAHSVALHYMHYSFCRIHKTLRTSPAMAAGVSTNLWSISDIVKMVEEWEANQKGK